MNERVYNRIANIAMLVGIASAVLFDSGKVPHAVVGTIGIVAGVTAIALYFWNQCNSEKKEEAPAKAPIEVAVQEKKPEVVALAQRKSALLVARRAYMQVEQRAFIEDVWKVTLGANYDVAANRSYHREAAIKWLSYYAANHARHLRYAVAKDATIALMQPEVELSPNEMAACAIEIVRNLAIADKLNQWEYVFNAKGLSVSMRRVHSVRPFAPQEELDFENSSVFAS